METASMIENWIKHLKEVDESWGRSTLMSVWQFRASVVTTNAVVCCVSLAMDLMSVSCLFPGGHIIVN